MYEAHPARHRNTAKMVPLVVHGDGTPCSGVGKSWSKLGDFWSWSSILAWSGSVQLFKYMVIMLHSHNRTQRTLDEFFEALNWSLRSLFLGRWLAPMPYYDFMRPYVFSGGATRTSREHRAISCNQYVLLANRVHIDSWWAQVASEGLDGEYHRLQQKKAGQGMGSLLRLLGLHGLRPLLRPCLCRFA